MEEKPQEKDKSPVSIENSPAVFWSRLKTKPGTEGTNQSNSPTTSPSTRTPETQPPRPTEEPTKKVTPSTDEETFGKKEQQPQELTETKDIEAEPVKEKDVLNDEAKPSGSNLKQASVPEMENQQFQPAQLKPLTSDAKHMNTTGQVFEVKISQPAKLMQTAKISPPSNLSQQPKTLPQSSETNATDENVLSSLVELQDKITEPVMNKEINKDDNEMIVSRVSETAENIPAVSPLEQPLELPSSNVKQMNDDEKFAIEEESTTKEEEAAKVKMKVKLVSKLYLSKLYANKGQKIKTSVQISKVLFIYTFPLTGYSKYRLLMLLAVVLLQKERQSHLLKNTKKSQQSPMDSHRRVS